MKVKIQDLMEFILFYFRYPALQPLGSLATWLHLGALQK
jgi:hypothetical protein